jgi:hypothetical protein
MAVAAFAMDGSRLFVSSFTASCPVRTLESIREYPYTSVRNDTGSLVTASLMFHLRGNWTIGLADAGLHAHHQS